MNPATQSKQPVRSGIDPDKLRALQVAKTRAHGLLAVAAGVFLLVVFVLPESVWTQFLKATAEAALVGGIADWFAVSALFREIPVPFLRRHTNIVEKNQERIAHNLAGFVEAQFLNRKALLRLMDQHQPVTLLGAWLATDANQRKVDQFLAQRLQDLLWLLDERAVRDFLRDAVAAYARSTDLSKPLLLLLESLTQDGRHQKILGDVIHHVCASLDTAQAREAVAERITQWLKDEHSVLEKILPTDWVSDRLSAKVLSIVDVLLDEIIHNRQHQIRHYLDAQIQSFEGRLRTDPALAGQLERLKQDFLMSAPVADYLNTQGAALRRWAMHDLQAPQSALRAQVAATVHWVARRLRHDSGLQQSLNQWLRRLIMEASPELSGFLSSHIAQTVHSWDARRLSEQVEVNIGKDLQRIRVNGTLLGAILGALLFGISHAGVVMDWL